MTQTLDTTALHRVFIGLGSNMDAPIQQLQQALASLRDMAVFHEVAISPFYQSTPLPSDYPQDDYINAVAAYDTSLSAHEVLDQLLAIETAQGRVRDGKRFAPRPLDLDLLLYDDKSVSSARLLLPHPGLSQRNFVLYPLADIAPDLILPNGQALQDLLQTVSTENLQQLEGIDV